MTKLILFVPMLILILLSLALGLIGLALLYPAFGTGFLVKAIADYLEDT